MNNAKPAYWCFDPVAALPGDLAALCLSFLDAWTLLGVAQRVNHAWLRAIDGSLPAVWRDVSLERAGVKLEEIVRKSHGEIMTLKLCTISPCLQSLTNLRMLHVRFSSSTQPPVTYILLSSFPLLEELCLMGPCKLANRCKLANFPPLQFLKKVQCVCCEPVSGLHNLPALTKLELTDCKVVASEPWPANLGELALYLCDPNHKVLDCIAVLQRLIALTTDWSFLCGPLPPTPPFFQLPFFPNAAALQQNWPSVTNTRPHDHLSFLTRLSALQRLSITSRYGVFPLSVVFSHLSAITSLRDLHLSYGDMEDQDMCQVLQLTNLQSIKLSYINKLTSEGIRHLSDLPNLSTLSLMGCSDIKDYTPVGPCTHLRDLEIVRDTHCMSLAEAQAVLHPRLDILKLNVPFEDARILSSICAIHTLRLLDLFMYLPVPDFSCLTSLSSLRVLSLYCMHAINISDLVDCLVQIPSLKYISLRCRGQQGQLLSASDEKRLRDALHRLETLTVW